MKTKITKNAIIRRESRESKSEEFKPSDLNFRFELKNCDFKLDALQEKMLQGYLRFDMKFRRAFNTNYTTDFFKFIQDKVKLNEPIHLSVMGQIRCQLKGNKVLMSDGSWKNIENIKIGDEVLSPQRDGSYLFSKVMNTTSYFSKNNYSIFQLNKRHKKLYSCSSNHSFPVYHRKMKRIKGNRKLRIPEWEIKDYTAEEHSKLNHSLKDNNIGISSFLIEKFKDRKNCEINPYVLGVYIGDGFFGKNKLEITNSKMEILSEVSKHYRIMNIYPRKDKHSFSYTFSMNDNLSILLKKYGLQNKKSGDKFIPKNALYSDSDYRKSLLAGLIDTDGTRRKNQSLSYVTKSKQLSKDIEFLVYSLGGRCEIRKRKARIRKINFEGEYYYISIYLGNLKIPQLVKYKKRKEKMGLAYLSSNRIAIKTKRIKSSRVYGFKIDSPSQLYITDNFMITHNSGKSYSMISVCIFHQACYGRLFDIDYVCANMFEFMEKLKTFSQDKLKDHIFLIDEEKQTVFGVGSTAKKMKITDVQNIIAINNISTIMINPISWANENAFYGLRAFGRDFKSKISRFMLYNLTGNKSAVTPMGMIYVPIFTTFLAKKYADILEKKYLDKKNKWVMQEQRGEGDVLSEIKRDSAKNFIKDKQFLSLKSKDQKTTYISQKLGSEWTRGEIDEIFNITKLLERGIKFD